jgi:MoaA/NifB/PqqE/SkfB family radical SAM enzyme
MKHPVRLEAVVDSAARASRRSVDGALGRALALALPLAARLPARTLAELVPPVPIDPRTGCRDLRDFAASRAPFLGVLAHINGLGDAAMRRSRVEAYLVHPVVTSRRRRAAARRRFGVDGLSALVVTPSVKCDLDCALCYNKGHRDPGVELPLDVMDRVVKEAASLGALRISIIGGEPLLRWRDVAALVERNPESLFTVMTNGQLLTTEVARAFAALPNVELAFSVDGRRETNDRFRGEGTYDRVVAAMACYRDAGGMLLYTPTITRENYREVLDDDFVETMIGLGAYMAYHHNYVMVGGQQRADLLLTADQRAWVSRRIREVVATKPILVVDNVESAIFRGGCQAGREYVHVNHRGEVEPCCMVQFARDDVRATPLVEILRSGFLAGVAKAPASARGVRECLVGAGREAFRTIVEREGAAPTGPFATGAFAADRERFRWDLPTCFAPTSTGRPSLARTPRMA